MQCLFQAYVSLRFRGAAGNMVVWCGLWNSWLLSSGCPLQHYCHYWICRGGHQVTVSCVPNWLLVSWKVTSINQMRSHCRTTPLPDSGPQPANRDSRLISPKSTITARRLNVSLFFFPRSVGVITF